MVEPRRGGITGISDHAERRMKKRGLKSRTSVEMLSKLAVYDMYCTSSGTSETPEDIKQSIASFSHSLFNLTVGIALGWSIMTTKKRLNLCKLIGLHNASIMPVGKKTA